MNLILDKFFKTEYFYNFLKYTASLITTFISFAYKKSNQCVEVLVLYIIFATISTVYSYYWDLTKDWGFLEKNSKHRFLRNQIAYKPYVYYIIICANTILRFAWILSISPSFVSSVLHISWMPVAVLIINMMEVFRSMHSLIRIFMELHQSRKGTRG